MLNIVSRFYIESNRKNNEPIDTSGLFDALERSASSLYAANNTLEESVALVTTANSVVQNPESVGTTFKTMSMRIRGAKTELEEAGLDTDGMADSVSKLRDEIMSLSGVDIMLDDSTFKSTYDIVLELSKVWNDLSDVSQANISELLAGKRGGNVISALMTNTDLLEETYETALNAEGSAEAELANYQEGLEWNINNLKASWEELSNTLLDSDLLKGIVQFGSGAITAINDIINSVGGLQSVFLGVSAVGLINQLKSVKQGLDISSAAKTFTAGFTSSMTDSTKQVTGLLGTVKAFTSAIAPMALGLAAVGATIGLVTWYYGRFDDAVETASESISNFEDEQNNLATLQTDAENLQSELESIAGEYEIDIAGMDDVDSIIDKIESSAGTTLSITDRATLEDLRAQNTELERQIALQEKTVETSQEQAKADADRALQMEATADLTTEAATYTQGDIFGNQTGITYENKNILDATRNEIEALKDLKQERNEAAESLKNMTDQSDIDKTNKSIEEYDNKISRYTDAISSQMESLSELKGAFDVGDQEYKDITQLEDEFANIDLSPLQQELSSLDTYFAMDGMEAVKDAIMDAVEAGKTASSVFQELGLSLDNIGTGVDASTFDAYFNDLIAGAEEAEEAINSVEGTVESMQAAAETANQNANWESAASLLSDAKDLYENGLVGTDDFKEAVQYLTPYTIDPDTFKYDSSAYVTAWENAQDKLSRYFDAENPFQSMDNALKDLESAGLATYSNGEYEWTKGFKNSADAADAFGVSVAAAEDILHGLEAYGGEFDQVFFSSEGLDEYETYLEGIKSTYDSMASGDTKDRLGSLIEGFDDEYAKYQDDITKLDEDAIVHIKFEYDIASLDSEIEDFRTQIVASYNSAEITAAMYATQKQRNNISAEEAGLNVEGVEVPIIAKIDERESDVQSQIDKLTKEGATEKETLGLRTELTNLEDMKSNIQDSFNNSEYAINVDEKTTAQNVEDAWSSFTSSGDMNILDIVANLSIDDTDAIKDLSYITGFDGQTIREAIELKDSEAINSFVDIRSMDGSVIHFDAESDVDTVKEEIESLEEQNTLIFTADIGGVETAVAAVKDEQGEITYVVNEDVNFDDAISDLSTLYGDQTEFVNVQTAADVTGMISDISGVSATLPVEAEAETDEAQSELDDMEGTAEEKAEAETDEAQSELDSMEGTAKEKAEAETDEAQSELDSMEGTAKEKAEAETDEAQSELDSMEGTAEEKAEAETDEAQSELDSMEGEAKVTADASDLENKVNELESQAESIDATIKINVDTSEMQSAIDSVFSNGTECNVVITADTSGVESAISEYQNQEGTIKFTGDASGVESAISEYKEETGTIKFTGDASGVSSAISQYKQQTGTITYTANTSGISSALASVLTINGTATVTFSADTSVPESYTPSDKTGNVVFNKDSSIPDNYQPADKNATVHYSADTSSLPSSFPTITRTVNYVATGATSVNGTAHANGTVTTLPRLTGKAKASGDVDQWSTEVDDRWKTKKSETALTGELGRELVVDTKNNRWYTVGDNGAEFAFIPAGSIVFNHQQTEDLLTTGSTEGTAHAQGTAYANGIIWGSSSSSSSSSSKSSSSSSSSKSSSSSSSKKKSSSSSKKKSSSSSSSSKDFEESLDWIEIEIDRIERAIDRLNLKAESTYNSWTTRNKNLSSEIAKITNEINVQQKAYDRYIKQANSVGLSSKYVKLVQNGTIDISTITDEDLADQIKEYQEW